MEAELHIFGSPSRDEMRKWTVTSLEVLVEQVRKRNLRSFEVLTEQKFGKLNFTSLPVKAEQKCGSEASDLKKSWQRRSAEAEFHISSSQGRCEVRKRNFTSLEELAEQKCGTELMSYHG